MNDALQRIDDLIIIYAKKRHLVAELRELRQIVLHELIEAHEAVQRANDILSRGSEFPDDEVGRWDD